MATKRAYKLQEFVAHSSSVNCLKIGRRTSRALLTGGEDHKVNLWAIGKPNPILSLSGHSSAIESVSFDPSEVLVAAGAASGTIKLWDLEEAKVVRTLTGHRSNCVSVDFHPFGEFFASGSLDTNLKIWDIRRKGCIHTYKGHTRGVNAIRFTPDGRWVVSGGQDNTVKLWDLTAGKLLNDFKGHEGQIQCIDFHPHEFLLATGSADRTVKFWDLETFELIGSAGPETAGVRSMTFNPDGRTLLCGLHESLKVFSWEPVRCHDTVDVGWSRLSDLNIHEGKLLGCSHNQGCVGVWVVDISHIEPYAIGSPVRSNGRPELKPSASGPSLQTDDSIKANMSRLPVLQNSETTVKSAASGVSLQTDNHVKASFGRLLDSQTSETATKETKPSASFESNTGAQRIGFNSGAKMTAANIAASPGATILKRSSSKTHNTTNIQIFNRPEVVPVVVPSPRNSSKVDLAADLRRETDSERASPCTFQSKLTNARKQSNSSDDSERTTVIHSGSVSNKITGPNEVVEWNDLSAVNAVNQLTAGGERKLTDIRCTEGQMLGTNLHMESNLSLQLENCDMMMNKPRNTGFIDVQRGGRTRTLVANWERRERSPRYGGPAASNTSEMTPAASIKFPLRGRPSSMGIQTVSASDEDFIADIMEQHEQFQMTTKSRLTKLQVVQRLWGRNDIQGMINAMEKISDHAVSADVVSVLIEKSDSVTLDVCTCLLPLLTSLLESRMDRHLGISLEMLLKLVKIFGPVVHSTISGPPLVGVDLHAEQRLERCNLCFIELEKVKRSLPSLTGKGGSITKSAQELNLSLQEVL